ncbi:uncharacterized protein LOC131437711 [Malaya genurostris]|uniref:uncharacterized protein LOC131437711 n=1 Tax=Malaya genurostris TaxID=325434 RepID=UPI0026F3A819|nr:uncharacterized protein LOC131437711 [Malaya genurostris]
MEANSPYFSSITPIDVSLQNAIKLECLELVQRSIDRGANIDCQYPDDWNSPLHLAVLSDCRDSLVQMLMNHQPTYGLVNGENLTAAELAFRNGHSSLGLQLIEAEFSEFAPEEALYQMLQRNSVEALEVLIKMLNLSSPHLVECLAKAWGKLEIMNVKLSPKLELFAQLFIIRSGYEETPQNTTGSIGSTISQSETSERMQLLMDAINCLEQKYDTGLCDDVNDEFLELLRLILKHLFFVKNRIEYFPVLQLEFCVAMYLAIFDRRPELDLFQLLINKCLIVKFLLKFKEAFLGTKKNDERMTCEILYHLAKVVITDKTKKCKEIIAIWKDVVDKKYSFKEQVMIRNKLLACSSINSIHSTQFSELTKSECAILKTEVGAINRMFESRKVRYRNKDLFRVYFKLKQTYSLQKAIGCLAIIEKIDMDLNPRSYVSMLAIQRSLQVLGESLKSTKLSPNISTNLRSALEFMAPGDILNRITKMRQFFSHEYSRSKHSLYNRLRLNDEELFLLCKRIQAELMKVASLLKNIYIGQIEKCFHSFLGLIRSLESVQEIHSLAKACQVPYSFKIDFDLESADVSGVDKLLHELESIYNNYEHKENLATVTKMKATLENYKNFLNRTTIDFMTPLVISSIGMLMLNENLMYLKNIVGYLLNSSNDPKSYYYGVKSLIMHNCNKELQHLVKLEANSLNQSADAMKRLNIIQNLMKLASAEEIDSMYDLVSGKKSCNTLKTTQEIVESLQLTLTSNDLLSELNKSLTKYYANLFALDEKYRSVKQFCKRHKLKYSNEMTLQCRKKDIIYYGQVFNELINDLADIIALPCDTGTREIVSLLASVESYQIDTPDILAIEIILLEILEILSTLGILSDNRAAISCYRPVINGRNLRNYLAHDALVYETLCRNHNPQRSVLLNAICLCRYLNIDLYCQNQKLRNAENSAKITSMDQWICRTLEQKTLLFQIISQGKFGDVSEKHEIKARTFRKTSIVQVVHEKHSEEFILFQLGKSMRMKPLFDVLLRVAPNQIHNFYDDDEFTIRQLASKQNLRNNANFYLALTHHHFELEQELDQLYGGAYTEDSLHLTILFRNERSALAIMDCPRLYAFCKSDAHRFGHTILAQAVLYKLPSVIRRICELSPEIIEHTNTAAETALFLAISVGWRKSVEILIEYGAKIHTPSNVLKSPIVYAVRMRKDELLDLLLPSDDDLSMNQDLLDQLINCAGYVNHYDLLRKLIPLTNSTNALANALNSASTKHNLEAIEVLLTYQPTLINIIFANGHTALFNACYGGSLRVIVRLLQQGADCNIPQEYSALFCAIDRNQHSVLRTCIEQNLISASNRDSLVEHLIRKSKLKMAWMAFEAGYSCSIQELKKLNNDAMLDIIPRMCLAKPEMVLDLDGDIAAKAILLKKEKLFNRIIDRNFSTMPDESRATILNSAIKVNNKQLIISLVDRGCDVNLIDTNGITSLAFAVSLGKSDLVKLLLKFGADPNRQSGVNCDVAFTAKSLIDVDSVVSPLSYPLILAIYHDHTKIAEFLLQNGAEVDRHDQRGATALIMAIFKGNIGIIQKLIALGASVEYACSFRHSMFEGGTAVHAAASFGQVEVLSCLIEQYGFDPNMIDYHGNTILHYAIMGKRANVLEYLKNVGCWTTANERGINPMQLALRELDSDIFQVVQSLPAITDAIQSFRNVQGQTVLHLAVIRGNVTTLQKLLDEFAFDVNQLDHQGGAPIYYAVYSRDFEKIKLLMSNSASLFVDNGEILTLVVHTNQTEVFKLCIDQDSENMRKLKEYRSKGNNSLLQIGVQKANVKMCELLLNLAGIDVNSVNENGNTALHLAATVSTMRMADLLLRYGSHLDMTNNDGKTPLLVAIEVGNVKVAQFLLARGASKLFVMNYRYETIHGMCLLHYVAKEGILDSVRFLINCEFFERTVVDGSGKHIGHYAATNNRGHVVEFLIASGFPLDLPDHDGRSAMVCSIEMGHIKIAKRLKAIGCSTRIVQNYNKTHSFIDYANSEIEPTVMEFLKECLELDWPQNIDSLPVISRLKIEMERKKTPVHFAIENNRTSEIEQIMSNFDLSPDCLDLRGQSPLHYSCTLNNLDATRKLLTLGATLDLQDDANATPLIYCFLNGHSKHAEVLIEAGASTALVISFRMSSRDAETVLHVAARNGFADVVKLLLKLDILPVDVGDLDLTTALQDAAMYGQIECVKQLLENGANPNYVDLQGTTSLTRAFTGCHRKMVELLLDYGVDLENSRTYRSLDSDGQTLLHHAVRNNSNLIEILIDRIGITVNSVDKNGRTPLHYAARAGLNAVVEILLKHNADPDILDNRQETPLISAIVGGYCKTAELISLKTTNYVNLNNYRSPDSQIPLLHIAFHKGFFNLIIQLLSKSVLDLGALDVEGRTVLHYAVADGITHIIEQFFSYSQLFFTADNNGITPLGVCFVRSNTEIFELILDGIRKDLNELDLIEILKCIVQFKSCKSMRFYCNWLLNNHRKFVEGNQEILNLVEELYQNTLIKTAIMENSIGLLQFILVCAVDKSVFREDKIPMSYLHVAAMQNFDRVAEMLILQANLPVDTLSETHQTPLAMAAIMKNMETAKVLLARGANVNHRDLSKRTPLLSALENDHKDMVELFLDHGADMSMVRDFRYDTDKRPTVMHFLAVKGLVIALPSVMHFLDPNCTDLHGMTPLHHAASNNQLGMIDFLADSGAMIDYMDKDGTTPLMRAASKGHIEAYHKLVEYGASKTKLKHFKNKNYDNETVLHMTAEKAFIEMTKVLIEELHCDIDCVDRDGNTPLHYAVKKGSFDAVKYLLKMKANIHLANNDGVTVAKLLEQKNYAIEPNELSS